MATLFHWDLPQALEDRGGWLQRDTAERFAEYAALVALRLGDRVEHWCPVNEPNVVTMLGHALGVHAPGKQLMFDALPVAHHLLLGHGRALAALRAVGAKSVGTANNHSPVRAASDDAADVAAAELYDTLWNRIFSDPILLGRYPAGIFELMPGPVEDDLAVISAPVDFYGLNYYNPTRIADPASPLEAEPGMDEVLTARGAPFKMVPLDGYERTAFGWPVVPDGLRETLVGLKAAYGDRLPPVYVTESGCAYDDVVGADGAVHDPQRVAYHDAHLRAVADAIADGVDVRGYYAWSLLDNFEWAEGYSKRFGLVHVDYATQRRTPKDSYALVPRPDRRPPVTTLPPTPGSVEPVEALRRPAGLGAQALGRLGHAGRARAVGGVLRADPGAARPAGAGGLARPQGVRVRRGDRRRVGGLGRRQPAVRRPVGPDHVAVRPAGAVGGGRRAARRPRARAARDRPVDPGDGARLVRSPRPR